MKNGMKWIMSLTLICCMMTLTSCKKNGPTGNPEEDKLDVEEEAEIELTEEEESIGE